ncbi:TonB-dependent receptor plug domain-containing protein [Brevundimonas aurantiaca]|uniref:TonB-dependent receptor plug domain-containing protein n=1 Tax=Brevundimonas aurantiaca TaxID=74316 RepID=UPI001CD2E498|nr:Plug domain-containing protein [Brevundimonas aurantiaca]
MTVSQLGRWASPQPIWAVWAGDTLVLVNGRGIAGAAGIEDGFPNLNGIPPSAVERVDITQAGSSALYGSDARRSPHHQIE